MGSPDDQETSVPRPPLTDVSGILKHVRKVIVFVFGSTVLLIGIAMIVLPGPAFVVIPVGLAILATEFVWARRWLRYVKRRAQTVTNWAAGSPRTTDKSE